MESWRVGGKIEVGRERRRNGRERELERVKGREFASRWSKVCEGKYLCLRRILQCSVLCGC